MAVAYPVLNLLYIDTYSCYSLGIVDFSQYPDNYNIVSPTIQITLPIGTYVTLPFTANSVNIFNSAALLLTCEGEDLQPLPDGIYQFKYTINPSTTYFVEKSILRIDQLQEKFDNAFLKVDMDCNSDEEDKKTLIDIELIIQEAVAAANKCAIDLAIKMYQLADTKLNQFNNGCDLSTLW